MPGAATAARRRARGCRRRRSCRRRSRCRPRSGRATHSVRRSRYVLTPVPSSPETSTATERSSIHAASIGVTAPSPTSSPYSTLSRRRCVVGVADHAGDVHARSERFDHREQHAGAVARDIHGDEARVGRDPRRDRGVVRVVESERHDARDARTLRRPDEVERVDRRCDQPWPLVEERRRVVARHDRHTCARSAVPPRSGRGRRSQRMARPRRPGR